MIHIDIDLLELALTDEWRKKAEEAYLAVKNATSVKDRNKAINDNSEIWRQLKDALRDLSHNKCWYCEASAHRIRGDVDHHRPKGRVRHYPPESGLPDLPGYWWLAFEWRNFRFACERCNRLETDHATEIVGGKQDYFPLFDPGKRIVDECDYEDLITEGPVLIDPTDPDDPALITFDMNGEAKSKYEEKDAPEYYRRADTSIKIYHLNHSDLVIYRQKEICFEVRELVRKVDRNLRKYQANRQDNDARVNFSEAITKLKRMTSDHAEHSATAWAALMSLRRPSRSWIERFLKRERIMEIA